MEFVLRLAVRFQASQFSSVRVRPRRAAALVRHVRRYGLASAGRCIPRGRRRQVRAPSGWARVFHLRDHRVLAAVLARPRVVRANGTFHEA